MKVLPSSTRTAFTPQVFKLDNGILVSCDTVTSVDSCAIGLWVRAGTRDDPQNMTGMAHFVEHTSFRKTRSKSSKTIARNFENVGAYANAYTTKEETCYHVRGLRESLPKIFKTLADVVVNPVFEESDVEKERLIISEEIRSYDDEAEEFVHDAAESLLFKNHPLGRPIIGTVDSISKITAPALQKFHQQHYNSANIVVCASGNIDPNELIELSAELFGHLPRSNKRPIRQAPPRSKRSEQEFTKPLQQSHLLWHTQTSGFQSKEYPALSLLNVILGDGMTSRLNLRVRESKGLAYNVYSDVQSFTDCGMFSVYAGTEENSASKARRIIERELELFATQGVKVAELKRAKEQIRAGKIMSLESLSSRMSLLGRGLLESGAPEDLYAFINRVMAVSLEDINHVAAVRLNASKWSFCSVIPTKADQ